MNAQNLQSSVESSGQLELLVKDRDHQISAYRDPDLGLHRVGARAVVMLDSQVAFDPSKEQLDAPAQLVEHGDRQSRNFQVVGQKHELFSGLQIHIFDAPQQNRKGFARPLKRRLANMVAAQSRQSIHWHRVVPRELKIAFRASDKECPGLSNQRQSREIHIAAVHEIKSSGFEEKAVEPSHIVLPRPSNVDACRNWAAQIDLGVHLDAGFGLSEIGPRKQGKRQVDCRGIQRIDRIVQIDTEIFFGIKGLGFADQALCEILPNPPVPVFVGFGQRRFGNRFAKAKVIERLGTSVEAGSDVAQTISRSHLSEDHADELLSALEMTDALLRTISGNESGKRLAIDEFDYLGEDVATGVHRSKPWKIRFRSSNA